ncbi:MAG: Sensor histidine kinase RcsC [Chroococcopsis gigantea SAG 12.99]|nr:Sensor histidine kinase RcsC [Chroococcopsis gigantea SAG 12.99]
MRPIRVHQSEVIHVEPKIRCIDNNHFQYEWLQKLTSLLKNSLNISFSLILNINQEDENRVYYCVPSLDINDDLADLSVEISYSYGKLLKRGEGIIIRGDEVNLPRSTGEIVHNYEIYSILITTIPLSDTSSGILCLYNCEREVYWAQRDINFIHNLIEQAYQLYRQERAEHYQQLINEVIYCLNYQKISLNTLDHILQRIGEVFNCTEVILLKIDNNDMGIYRSWHLNYPQNELSSEWFASTAADDWQSPRQWHKPESLDCRSPFFGSLVSLPIFPQGTFWGALLLKNENSETKKIAQEIKYLELLSEQIGIVLFRLQQQELAINEDKLKKINEFLSHMTHELRAPLSGVLGFAKMLQEQIYGTLNDKQTQYINAIASSGEHLLALVNDFLDLSKIEANYEELFREKLPVEDICQASLSMVRCKAEEQKLDLRLEIAPDVDFCNADQQRLKQILVNLLSNAIKFTEKGSVILKVEKVEQYLAFSVIDTGIGIPEEEQERLFQPFIQLNNSLSRKHKGTGLGLALSRRLALLHGGDITLISQPGKGSCFRLKIPHAYIF